MENLASEPRRSGMLRNVMHLGLGQAVTTILTILTNATLARTLSTSDFGLLFLAVQITSFTFVIVDWGHGAIIIRETARHPDRSGNLLGSALAARSAFAVVACAVMLAATWLLGYDLYTRLLISAVILVSIPQYLGLSFGWVFRGYERMDLDAILNVVFKLMTLLGSIACVVLGGRVPGIVLTWLLAGCLTLAMGIIVFRRMRFPALSATGSTIRELLQEGAPMFAMSVTVAIEPFINANILYKTAPAAVIGWFGAAWSIAGTLIAPATILATTMYPRLSTAAGDTAEFKRAFDISFRPLLLLAILGAVGTYLFADVAIGLIYTLEKFGPAAGTLRAFVPVLLLMYIDVFLANAVVAAGRAGRLAGAKVAAVALTTGLVFFLVPLCQAWFGNGGLGVMYAMAIGEVVMLAAAALLLREAIDAHTIWDVGRSLIAGVATVFLMRLLPPLTPFLTIPLCVLVFAALSLLVGAAKRSDMGMLLGIFRKRQPTATRNQGST